MEKSFILTLDGTEYTIEVHGNTFIVDGHPYVVGFEDDDTVTVDGIGYDITLEKDTAIVDGVTHSVQVRGLETALATLAPVPSAPAIVEAGSIQAIMPGSIVRVLVAEGDQVSSGDVLLVLEAMKMENELKAPIPGVVKAIYVQRGQTVEMGAVLAEIEALD